MAHIPKRSYSWDEMVSTYEIQMLASYEKAKGRTLHGEELSALSFWLLQDTEKKGSLAWEPLKDLMEGLRFAGLHNQKAFRREFEFSIADGEFKKQEVFRFDLIRQIFLDRGL